MITSYKELTISKYLEIKEILCSDSNDMAKKVEVLSLLTEKSVDELYDMPYNDFQKLDKEANFLYHAPTAKSEAPDCIILNGTKYRVTKKISDMTAGQYIDYQSIIGLGVDDAHVPNLISCFLIPDGKKYCDGYDVSKVTEDVANYLDMATALNACFFFRKKLMKLITNFRIYSDWKLKRIARKMEDKEMKTKILQVRKTMEEMEAFLKNGNGLLSLTPQVK